MGKFKKTMVGVILLLICIFITACDDVFSSIHSSLSGTSEVNNTTSDIESSISSTEMNQSTSVTTQSSNSSSSSSSGSGNNNFQVITPGVQIAEKAKNDVAGKGVATEITTADFKLTGYGVGTTGGFLNGKDKAVIKNVYNGKELLAAFDEKHSGNNKGNRNTPYIIYIHGEINQANTGAKTIAYKDINNFSIIGVGSDASLNGLGFTFERCKNIVIQNLTIHHVLAGAGEGDGIGLVTCENVWIDHCEFYNEPLTYKNGVLDESSKVKDKYDALLDIKKLSYNITISWNYFHDSYKTGLVGFSDSDNVAERNVTFHHNTYENINSRTPLLRAGKTHIYNQYYKGVMTTGINSRLGNRVLVENVIFDTVKGPICSVDSSDVGFWNLKNIAYINCIPNGAESGEIAWNIDLKSTTIWGVDYNYTINNTYDLIPILEANRGPGIWTVEGYI